MSKEALTLLLVLVLARTAHGQLPLNCEDLFVPSQDLPTDVAEILYAEIKILKASSSSSEDKALNPILENDPQVQSETLNSPTEDSATLNNDLFYMLLGLSYHNSYILYAHALQFLRDGGSAGELFKILNTLYNINIITKGDLLYAIKSLDSAVNIDPGNPYYSSPQGSFDKKIYIGQIAFALSQKNISLVSNILHKYLNAGFSADELITIFSKSKVIELYQDFAEATDEDLNLLQGVLHEEIAHAQ